MNARLTLVAILAAAAALVVFTCVYYVDQREKAIVFQFGEIIRSDDSPGLHFKLPWRDVQFFDARIQTMDSEPELYLTLEKKNLVVDSFVKWRIADVARFYVTMNGLVSNARSRLTERVNDSLRAQFSRRLVIDVISGDRVEIMDVVRKGVDERSRSIGIEVVDVRLKRVDLDPAVSERVYSRMEAERSRVAKELRARGAEAAERIRADADRQREITVAEAFRDAEKLRGEGDAQATNIYADAFGRDREFYGLYRSLNAYKQTFRDANDLLVIDPSGEFFKYFNQPYSSSSPAQTSGN